MRYSGFIRNKKEGVKVHVKEKRKLLLLLWREHWAKGDRILYKRETVGEGKGISDRIGIVKLEIEEKVLLTIIQI